MTACHEVWVEFDDGSVAKYSVTAEEFDRLIQRLAREASCSAIWVDGRSWPMEPASEAARHRQTPEPS
jgi:hypothetical protein